MHAFQMNYGMTRNDCETMATAYAGAALLTTSTAEDVTKSLTTFMRGLEKVLLSDNERAYKLQQATLAQELVKAYIKRATHLGII